VDKLHLLEFPQKNQSRSVFEVVTQLLRVSYAINNPTLHAQDMLESRGYDSQEFGPRHRSLESAAMQYKARHNAIG